MSVATECLSNAALPPAIPMRWFSVDEYHRMIDAGVFAEDEQFELLEGWIVGKMTRKPRHDATIMDLHEVFRTMLPAGWCVRGQSAVTTSDSEPEPDIAIARGGSADYVDRHPGPADLAVVVEVSDSTLARDRDLKGRVYARAGVSVYWVVNLVDQVVEVYTDPTGPTAAPAYRTRRDHIAGDPIPLLLPGSPALAVDPKAFLH